MTSSTGRDVKMAINGPVFFLIQEQAKSVVAIQALQTRMAVLENLQERLMLAISNVNHHLASSSGTEHLHKAAGQSEEVLKSSLDRSEKKLRFCEANSNTPAKPESYGAKQELSKSDSLNKDSGISTSDNSLPSPEHPLLRNEEEDELWQLLDLIDQKSLILLKEVEEVGTTEASKSESQMGEGSSSRLLDNLLFEKVDTQRQLSEIKAERDDLSQRLAKLELATEAVTKQKLVVQRQLNETLLENQTLQRRINNSDVRSKTESLGYLADIERSNIRRKYLQYSEKSKEKVSKILREGNVLELKKQLLTYVMETDILRAKLQQDDTSKMGEWLKIESQLRKELKESIEENKKFNELLQAKDLEIASLKDKIRCIEEGSETDSCVKNFGMASTDDWREPGVQNAYQKRNNLNAISPFSPLGYGDFSKTQSLPAMQLDARAKLKEQESSRQNFCHVYDTSSFTEVPLDQSFPSGQADNHSSHNGVKNSKDLVDFTSPAEPNYSSTSTLVQSQYLYQPSLHSGLSAPNLSGRCTQEALQNWRFAPRKSSAPEANDTMAGTRIVNGHLCWKGVGRLSTSQDVSSICTEFDPLTDDSPSCENFVDSLNLSIPLKPTPAAIPQLSSIGDSLHSASLELGCSSSPVMCQETKKILNARSVDGIRDLLVDNIYCKRPHSSQYGHSSVAPVLFNKSGRRMPVNLMNCMHETSDYSLM